MYSLILAVIYAAFISLGLPDAILGAAWPSMQPQMAVPVSFAGIISMIISIGTVVSSLLSDRLNRKFGTGPVTAVSVFMTAAALFGFSLSGEFWMLCILAVPYGLGAGAVDAALNNYVALHYSSRHMSWLHCFWGIGASAGPYIMGLCLRSRLGWQSGYRTIAIAQFILTAALFFSLPLWKKADKSLKSNNGSAGDNGADKPVGFISSVKIRGVPLIMLAFFSYCAFESTAGLWASSYFVSCHGINEETAAMLASLYFAGITAGRFFSGFIADRLGDRRMIRYGLLIIFLGLILMIIPVSWTAVSCAGIVIAGLGSAPVYPSVIHETPANFGSENSQSIIGIQMASAYLGTTIMPPLFGVISENTTLALYPVYLIVLASVTFVMTELLNRITASGH